MDMFCYQCEQTREGAGCVEKTVCGKSPETAALHDLVVHAVKGIAQYAHRAAELGKRDPAVDRFVIEALFATVTNVDFDSASIQQHLLSAVDVRDKARDLYESACREQNASAESLNSATQWQPAASRIGLINQGREVSIPSRMDVLGEDVTGLQELILYGLKGTAAYMDHALVLGQERPEAFAVLHAALDFLCEENPKIDDLVAWALKVGELNLQVMEMLDAAHTGEYGQPEPTEVRTTPVKGKAILVSGHDLKDLDELLKQTEGKGVNVYTHGEMLPCLAYPELKKHTHFVGHFGGAWQDQKREFTEFPGPILMTTNCIVQPMPAYKDRIYTTGMVRWPGVEHIGADKDFTPLIESALANPGFTEDAPEKKITIGFGHHAVLGVADKVIDAVKSGAIRHFFLIGGCDGFELGRNYYTDFAKSVPENCVILTLACGKFRFNDHDFGTIGGLPRLLDMGQCNDAYSAIKVASALAEAFDCEVNDLPLSMILSWFEQKAVAILLTLLYLGIKDMRLGPRLPAFITPTVLNVLVENFNIQPIRTAEEDLATILA